MIKPVRPITIEDIEEARERINPAQADFLNRLVERFGS